MSNVAVTEGKRLVVIGSSFISMELIVAVTKRNLASIDVIGMESAPFEAVLGKEVGAALQKVCSVSFCATVACLRILIVLRSSTNRKASNST